MASNRFKPGMEIYDYFPEVARANMSKREARAEYARLRKIANRRLEALMRYFPESKTAKRYRKGFAALPREEKTGRIYKKLYEVARYLNEQQGSVSGQRSYRKKSIESLHASGYGFINQRNFDQFAAFMDEVKTHSLYRSLDSEQAVILFGKAVKKKMDPQKVAKAFEKYQSEKSPLKDVKVRIADELVK